MPEPAYVKVDEKHALNFFEGLIKISAIIKSFEDLNGQNSSSIWMYVARSHISFLDKLKLIFYYAFTLPFRDEEISQDL